MVGKYIQINKCRTSRDRRIVITHGTDNLIETAKFIAIKQQEDETNDLSNKTIVLVGAMRPQLFQNSDANFNIGCAVGAARVLPPGIFIAMNGQVYTYTYIYILLLL